MIVNCKVCGKEFKTWPSKVKIGRGKYCSRICSDGETQFKKGVIQPGSILYVKGQPGRKGEESYSWKGDKVGYVSLHEWVRSRLGDPMKCEFCKTTTAKKYHWANKSLNYKRDLNDWIRLCIPCHRKYDRAKGWGVASYKFPIIRG